MWAECGELATCEREGTVAQNRAYHLKGDAKGGGWDKGKKWVKRQDRRVKTKKRDDLSPKGDRIGKMISPQRRPRGRISTIHGGKKIKKGKIEQGDKQRY